MIQPKIINQTRNENERIKERRSLKSPIFKSMKTFYGHTRSVYDFCVAKFPDGKNRIISCSYDKTLRIYNIEKGECENIIKYSTSVYSVHFYKEKSVLMSTDWNGELLIWNLFPKIKIIKKLVISKPKSILWKLTQISKNEFICCVRDGASKGCIYRIEFNNNNNWIVSEIEHPPNKYDDTKERLYCIYQLKLHKNVILFAGGDDEHLMYRGENDGFNCIKKYDLENSQFVNFPGKHQKRIYCLDSYLKEKRKGYSPRAGQIKGRDGAKNEFGGKEEIITNIRLELFRQDQPIWLYSIIWEFSQGLSYNYKRFCFHIMQKFIYGEKSPIEGKNEVIVTPLNLISSHRLPNLEESKKFKVTEFRNEENLFCSFKERCVRFNKLDDNEAERILNDIFQRSIESEKEFTEEWRIRITDNRVHGGKVYQYFRNDHSTYDLNSSNIEDWYLEKQVFQCFSPHVFKRGKSCILVIQPSFRIQKRYRNGLDLWDDFKISEKSGQLKFKNFFIQSVAHKRRNKPKKIHSVSTDWKAGDYVNFGGPENEGKTYIDYFFGKYARQLKERGFQQEKIHKDQPLIEVQVKRRIQRYIPQLVTINCGVDEKSFLQDFVEEHTNRKKIAALNKSGEWIKFLESVTLKKNLEGFGIKIFDSREPRVEEFHVDHIMPVSNVDSKDGGVEEIILSGGRDFKVFFWNIEGQVLKKIQFFGPKNDIDIHVDGKSGKSVVSRLMDKMTKDNTCNSNEEDAGDQDNQEEHTGDDIQDNTEQEGGDY